MKSNEQPLDPKKLKGAVRLAGLRLAKARRQLKTSKEQSRLAKRRRKEARQAFRRARKQARQAKGEFKAAEKILADAKAKLAQANRLRAAAQRRKKSPAKAVLKTGPGQGGPTQPTVAVPRDFGAPTPAPASSGGLGPAPAGAGQGVAGKTEAEPGN